MKRVVSIFLLTLLLYHHIGYFLIFQLRQTHVRQELRQAIESKTRPEHDWLVIAVPITLYHQLDRDFETVEGEFSYQGKVYEKAMQRVQNDTLFIYCVNNLQQEKVLADLSEHLKAQVANGGDSTHKKSESWQKSFVKNYYLPQDTFFFPWQTARLAVCFGPVATTAFLSEVVEVYTPPPQTGLCRLS